MNVPPLPSLSEPDGPRVTAAPLPKTSALAISSLLLGLLGLLILPAIGGMVCGLIAQSRISRSNGQLKGKGLALAGIIVSGVMLLLIPVVAILAGILLPALSGAKVKAQTIMGMSNVKQICLGLSLHALDHDDKFPTATNWCDAVSPSVGGLSTVFRRPNNPSVTRSDYGYNARLAGLKSSEVPTDTVLVFELQTGGWNISGGPELLRHPSNRRELVVVGFADGHAEAMTSDRLGQLRWNP